MKNYFWEINIQTRLRAAHICTEQAICYGQADWAFYLLFDLVFQPRTDKASNIVRLDPLPSFQSSITKLKFTSLVIFPKVSQLRREIGITGSVSIFPLHINYEEKLKQGWLRVTLNHCNITTQNTLLYRDHLKLHFILLKNTIILRFGNWSLQ